MIQTDGKLECWNVGIRNSASKIETDIFTTKVAKSTKKKFEI